jgi:hypothetical protein
MEKSSERLRAVGKAASPKAAKSLNVSKSV